MNLKKIFFSLVVCIPIIASAATIVSPSGHTLQYRINGTTASIIEGNSKTLSGYLVIPDTIIVNNKVYVVDSIGVKAFLQCTTLINVVIPNTIKYIGNQAFYGCTALSGITLGNKVLTIGDQCFSGCKALRSFSMPNSVIDCGGSLFYNCSNLLNVNLSQSLKKISRRMFYDCDSLQNIIIPDSVVMIDNEAFRDSRISSITIGNSVELIDTSAFYHCTIDTIISYAFNPPVIILITIAGGGLNSANVDINSFQSTKSSRDIPIYIPCGRLVYYYARWNYFTNFIEMGGHDVTAVSADTTMGKVTILSPYSCSNPQMIISAQSYANYHFTHWSDGNQEAVRSLDITQDTHLVA